MHFSFHGIVLDQVPYSDNSIIVKFLSRENGLQSVLAKGLKGKRGKSTRPLLNKMNVVEVEAFRRKDGQLAMLKDVRSASAHQGMMDVRRNAVVLFINEVLCRTVKEGHEDPEMFDLVLELMNALRASSHFVDLHLIFLLRLTSTFGAQPELPSTEPDYFDLLEGAPCSVVPGHGHFVEGHMCVLFLKCLQTELKINAQLGINNEERRELLERILEYHRLQFDEKLELRSYAVLREVLE